MIFYSNRVFCCWSTPLVRCNDTPWLDPSSDEHLCNWFEFSAGHRKHCAYILYFQPIFRSAPSDAQVAAGIREGDSARKRFLQRNIIFKPYEYPQSLAHKPVRLDRKRFVHQHGVRLTRWISNNDPAVVQAIRFHETFVQ